MPTHATRADKAGLMVQDVVRSSLQKHIQRTCILCHRVIASATLPLLETKYKTHLRACRHLV